MCLRVTREQIGKRPDRADGIVGLYQQPLEVAVELCVVTVSVVERADQSIGILAGPFDGKFVVISNDDTLSAEDIALGYKGAESSSPASVA
jgi:hypothetical protein